PEQARLHEVWGPAALQQGRRLQEAKSALEEALAFHRDRGENVAAGRVLTLLAAVLQRLGGRGKEKAIEEALALLEAQPAGPELVAAYAELAASHAIRAAYPEAITAAERALTLALELGLPEPARALGHRGVARAYQGEQAGLEDMRHALELAVEQGQGRAAAVLH